MLSRSCFVPAMALLVAACISLTPAFAGGGKTIAAPNATFFLSASGSFSPGGTVSGSAVHASGVRCARRHV